MATSIVSQPGIDDIASSSAEALALSKLIIWINAARAFIDKVNVIAGIDPSLADHLKKYDFRLQSASWEGDTAIGMEYLLAHQTTTIGLVSDAAEALARSPRIVPSPTAARSRPALSQSLAQSV